MHWLRKAGIVNLLVVFVPVAAGMQFAGAPELWIFLASALAIVPLAGLMGKCTEILADQLGAGIGGLLNASFGNAAELLIAIFALRAGLVDVVKASITGSILGNVLLVLGASFLAGGIKYSRQTFNPTAAGVSATLLALAAVGLLMPAIFHVQVRLNSQPVNEPQLSMEIAGVLFVCYLLMLFFSLRTHKHLYLQPLDEVASETHAGSTKAAIVVLAASTGLIAWMSELLVGTIEVASKQLGWTEFFVGAIVVAIVGNAAEHWTAVAVALKNRTELSVQIAVGSGLQVALFVAPLLVFISRLPGLAPLDLVFTTVEVAAVAVSVIVVGLVAHDGESTWIEGLLLIAVYLIIAIAFFHVPAPPRAAAPPF
jgi:Ca2+:H+ antiporter